jgi:hypothetical protein
MTNYLRSDENAANSEIERSQNRDSKLKKTLGTGVALGSAVIGGGLASRVLPLLNEYVPADLALKGINKLSPQLGKLLKNGVSQGLNLREGFNFLKDQILSKEESQKQPKEQPKENRNIIEQYSPELHQVISQEIKKGRSPIEATNRAVFENKKFESIIKKIMQDHKTPWSTIIESIYGKGDMGQPSQEQDSQQQQQSGQGQQALREILNKINQRFGQ